MHGALHIFVIVILSYPLYQLLHTFHSLNPLLKELADFKFTDIYFGHFQDSELDDEIYVSFYEAKANW